MVMVQFSPALKICGEARVRSIQSQFSPYKYVLLPTQLNFRNYFLIRRKHYQQMVLYYRSDKYMHELERIPLGTSVMNRLRNDNLI